MASANASDISLRLEPSAYKRLGYALAISAAVHLLIFLLSLLVGSGKLEWLTHFVPKWLKPETALVEALKKEKPKLPEEPDIPLMFVDVNPEQAVTEAPKKTPYYSDKNSRAANPEPSIDTEAPKVDGKKTEIVKTEDIPKTRTFPLAPSIPRQDPQDQPEMKAKPKYTPGDLVMAKPEDKPKESPGKEQLDRPRTLKEARARQPLNNRLAGEKMKQDGSVKRRSLMSSLDVTATEFGAYDAAIIAAVQNRWYDLLDNRNYAGEQTGKVTLKFRLNVDGSVSEVSFLDSTVDLALGMLCQSAIKDPARYAPWPSDMRRKIGDSFREVTFTFYYY